MSFLVAAPVFS